jgi:hypothetical protein
MSSENITYVSLEQTVSGNWSIYPKNLYAKKVFYRPPYTTVLWNDGTKTTVKAHNEEFSKELGLAWATVKKVYVSRGQFVRDFENGIEQPSQ